MSAEWQELPREKEARMEAVAVIVKEMDQDIIANIGKALMAWNHKAVI